MPLFCLQRSAVAERNWGDNSCQISNIPATPMRESSPAVAANARAHLMSIELAALRAAEPPKDARSDLASRTAQDALTVAERLLGPAAPSLGRLPSATEEGPAAKRARTDQCDPAFVFVSPDPLARAASLRGPPGVNPLDSVSACHDPAMIAKL